MGDAPTLHSRLRVLVARTFRAEKLYSSMRNNGSAGAMDSGKLAEIANDVRSSVWQKRHYQLRKAINHVLSEAASSDISAEVLFLQDRFKRKADQHRILVEEARKTLVEAVERSEFARSLSLSLELIKNKAEMQANQIIADELSAAIQGPRKNRSVRESSLFGADLDMSSIEARNDARPASEVKADISSDEMSNVVPFRRKVSGLRGSH